MKFLYSWIKEYAPSAKLSPEEAARLLTFKSFEVESVEKIGKADAILHIDILPNRSHDALSHLGIARELVLASGTDVSKAKIPKYPLKESKQKTKDALEVEVSTKVCARYVVRIVKGVKIESSPKWLKEKIEALGLNSINNLVDATNYVMLAIGQPLHVFDFDKLSDSASGKKKIIVRPARKGEKIETLDDKTYELNDQMIVISDLKNSQAIAGIKGGKAAGISMRTKNIVIESANFEPTPIRKTSRALGLRTDASVRFEAGLGPSLANEAMDLVAGLIQKIAGGEVLQGQVIGGHWVERSVFVSAAVGKIQKLIGCDISEKEIIKILQNMGCEVQKINLEKRLKEIIKPLLGKPYKYGASATLDAPNQFDCSGFTSYVFRKLGIEIPRVSIDQRFFGKEIDKSGLCPGDLVFQKGHKPHFSERMKEGIGHVGIYIGGGKVVHASGQAKKVVVGNLKEWLGVGEKSFRGAARILHDKDLLLVKIPSWRRDLVLAEDLVEEVARLYGLENIKEIMPTIPLALPLENPERDWARFIKNTLFNSGFSEVKNYSFVGENLPAGVKNSNAENFFIELENPVNPELKYLRPTLVFGFLRNITLNYLFSKRLLFFELGSTFYKLDEKSSKARHMEKNALGGAICIQKAKDDKEAFYELKGFLADLLGKMGIDDFWLDDARPEIIPNISSIFHPLRKAEIKIGKFSIGYMGEIDQSLLKKYDISGRVAIFEIDFKKLSEIASAEREYIGISKYPSIIRDISLVVDNRVKIDDVQSLIEGAGGGLLFDSDLFDIYEGENLEEGKKSLAFHLIFQSSKRTLKDEEVDKVVNDIILVLEKEGFEVRKA
ncbi:MAG: Phenylalanine-tRNA ligase beta subunit [Parcubacteria group bacterium GW2011_GWA2_39_18]|nr:MAG: Phenylalanine-tRNA ligase beta subunit [Parcubacteria group bacterium GW2011_GWA2_39_18]